MRMLVTGAISLAASLALTLSTRAPAQNLPACHAGLSRHGNQITVGWRQLSRMFNAKLSHAHSHYSHLRLADDAGHLKVSGAKDGKTLVISGPLEAVGNGSLRLHADHIVRDGHHDKGLMDLFGKDLADYAHFSQTQSLSANKDNLYIHPDPLLNVASPVTAVSLSPSSITLTFASQPCR